jgi:hypothetical protein
MDKETKSLTSPTTLTGRSRARDSQFASPRPSLRRAKARMSCLTSARGRRRIFRLAARRLDHSSEPQPHGGGRSATVSNLLLGVLAEPARRPKRRAWDWLWDGTRSSGERRNWSRRFWPQCGACARRRTGRRHSLRGWPEATGPRKTRSMARRSGCPGLRDGGIALRLAMRSTHCAFEPSCGDRPLVPTSAPKASGRWAARRGLRPFGVLLRQTPRGRGPAIGSERPRSMAYVSACRVRRASPLRGLSWRRPHQGWSGGKNRVDHRRSSQPLASHLSKTSRYASPFLYFFIFHSGDPNDDR